MALTTAFARNGNRKAVPQTAADGSVNYNDGFGASYALPPEQGGKFIDREQFNQLMFDTTSAILENQAQLEGLYLTEDVTKTVGASGDFPSWVEAYEYCSKISPNTPYTLTLQLIPGCPPLTESINGLDNREYPFLKITTGGIVISDFYNSAQLSANIFENFKININRNDSGYLLNLQCKSVSNCDINITTNSNSRRMRIGSSSSSLSIYGTTFTFNGSNTNASISLYHMADTIIDNCSFVTTSANTVFIANRGSRIYISANTSFAGGNSRDVTLTEAGILISSTCRTTNVAQNQLLNQTGQWIK